MNRPGNQLHGSLRQKRQIKQNRAQNAESRFFTPGQIRWRRGVFCFLFAEHQTREHREKSRIQENARHRRAQRQQTARIILTMVENLGGEIQSVTEDADWKITGTGGSELLAYSNAEKKITAHGMTLIDGLEEATAAMNGQLLSFTLKTGKGSYKTSV